MRCILADKVKHPIKSTLSFFVAFTLMMILGISSSHAAAFTENICPPGYEWEPTTTNYPSSGTSSVSKGLTPQEACGNSAQLYESIAYSCSSTHKLYRHEATIPLTNGYTSGTTLTCQYSGTRTRDMSCNADIEGEENAQYSFTSQGQCVEIPNCPPSGEETGYKSFNTVSDTFCDGQCEHTKDPNGSSLGDQFYYGACPSGQQDECTWQRYDSISTGNECETTDPVPDENSTDDDQDGVPNDDDECEATPTDGQGVVDEYGCLVDDPNATPDPSASPSPSPTASPTASPNPSGSPEPTGSPQPTGSPAPSGSPSPTDGGGDEGGGDGGGGDGTCDPQLENCGTGEEGEGAIQVQGKSARTIGESIGVMGTSLDNSPLMQSFDSISVPSSAGTCPTAELALFNDTYSMDAHCGIIEENRALFAAIMLAVWGMVAVYIVMRA